MTSRVRTVIFLISAVGLASLLGWGFRDLPVVSWPWFLARAPLVCSNWVA